jgi:hypothetical protein
MISTTPNTKPDPVTLATRTNNSIDLKERLFGFSVRVKVIPALGKERTKVYSLDLHTSIWQCES